MVTDGQKESLSSPKRTAASRRTSFANELSKSVVLGTVLNSATTIVTYRWQFDPKEEGYFNMEFWRYLQSRTRTFQV